ncbi:hypothetical protein IKP85_05205 [bacterium]|nr:hypothetical protein [bacterium]
MEVKRVEPSFGLVLKHPKSTAIDTYMRDLPRDLRRKMYSLIDSDKENKLSTYLDVIGKWPFCRLSAEVGGKTFKENIFWGPVSTLRRALKYSRKQNAEQQAINQAWGNANINVPKLQ